MLATDLALKGIPVRVNGIAPGVFPTTAVNDALAASLATGTFTDTAYYLCSRRLANGGIGCQRIIYANSAVLKAAGNYFVTRE